MRLKSLDPGDENYLGREVPPSLPTLPYPSVGKGPSGSDEYKNRREARQRARLKETNQDATALSKFPTRHEL